MRADGICVLFAIESGSRAWGFPSPDSDYDCRFLYVRPLRDHLVLQQQRDVIEFPIEGEIDVGGWDLRKALLLAIKGNAAVVEWTRSLHVYEEREGFRSRFLSLLEDIVQPDLVARHYRGLFLRHAHVFAENEVRLKSLFYALRPALALEYMREREFSVLPPMDIAALLDGISLSAPLRAEIKRLVTLKAATREMGRGTAPAEILNYLRSVAGGSPTQPASRSDASSISAQYALAEAFYRREVLEAGASAEL